MWFLENRGRDSGHGHCWSTSKSRLPGTLKHRWLYGLPAMSSAWGSWPRLQIPGHNGQPPGVPLAVRRFPERPASTIRAASRSLQLTLPCFGDSHLLLHSYPSLPTASPGWGVHGASGGASWSCAWWQGTEGARREQNAPHTRPCHRARGNDRLPHAKSSESFLSNQDLRWEACNCPRVSWQDYGGSLMAKRRASPFPILSPLS